MSKWILPGAAAALAVALSGCGGRCASAPAAAAACLPVSVVAEPAAPEPAAAKPPASEDLLHRRFALVSADGRDIAVDEPSQRPDIEFTEGFQIAGRVCNRFRGPAELRGGRLYADRLASTMMMCLKPELNELERLFHAMLRAGADVALAADGSLILSQGGHTLVYERADWVR